MCLNILSHANDTILDKPDYASVIFKKENVHRQINETYLQFHIKKQIQKYSDIKDRYFNHNVYLMLC